MRRDVLTVCLFPRPNVHVTPSLARDVVDVVKGATALFLWLCIAVLVMA